MVTKFPALRMDTWNCRSLTFERFQYYRSLGYDVSSVVLEARDLWARKALPDFTIAQGLAAKDLPPNGGVAMIKVWPKKKNE